MYARRERLVWAICLLTVLAAALVCFLFLREGRLDWLQRGLDALAASGNKPRAFGGFHLVWLLLCVGISVVAGIVGARTGKRKNDAVVFAFGMAFVVLELLKQGISYFSLYGGVYDFGIFPFQFCSLPLYLFTLLPLFGGERLREWGYRFAALYGTMGGCLVMGYPRFYSTAFLNWHTMLWHTLMIAVGVFLIFARGYGIHYRREMLPATAFFLSGLGIATGLNLLLEPLTSASPNPLNLFYMSPYHSTYFLVVRDVQRALGWLPSLLTYVLLFVLVGATTVWGLSWLIRRCIGLRKKDFV